MRHPESSELEEKTAADEKQQMVAMVITSWSSKCLSFQTEMEVQQEEHGHRGESPSLRPDLPHMDSLVQASSPPWGLRKTEDAVIGCSFVPGVVC